MDVVYILGSGSVWNDNEIRYSLRSLYDNVFDLGTVFVVGERPDWLANVNHVPVPDSYPEKWQNAFLKVRHACTLPELSEEFLLMNDDFYFTQPQRAADYPFFYSGFLPGWRVGTNEILRNYGHSFRNYAVHVPIRLRKTDFLSLPDILDHPHPVSPRSLYGNFFTVGGSVIRDPIITPSMSPQTIEKHFSAFLSISIQSLTARRQTFRDWVQTRFPNPSIYESDH